MFILLHFSPHSWVIENSFDFCDRIFNLSADVCQQCLASFAKHEASSPVPEGGLKVVGSPACPARHSAIQRRDLWLDWRISRGYREKDRCGLLQATTGGCLGCRNWCRIGWSRDSIETWDSGLEGTRWGTLGSAKNLSHRCSSQVETWVETWKLPEKILWKSMEIFQTWWLVS